MRRIVELKESQVKRIWNDPVGSKVIAGLILGGISLSATAAYKYWSATGSENQSFYTLLINSSIELNSLYCYFSSYISCLGNFAGPIFIQV